MISNSIIFAYGCAPAQTAQSAQKWMGKSYVALMLLLCCSYSEWEEKGA